MEKTLIPGKIYAITFDGLLFIGLYESTDDVHHFIDVYGLSDTTEKATFSKKCTFDGPFEPDVDLHTIVWAHSTITDPSRFIGNKGVSENPYKGGTEP